VYNYIFHVVFYIVCCVTCSCQVLLACIQRSVKKPFRFLIQSPSLHRR